MEQLCGREVTSIQVSRAVQRLDDEALHDLRTVALQAHSYCALSGLRISGTCAQGVALG
jgi:hypothetical protein